VPPDTRCLRSVSREIDRFARPQAPCFDPEGGVRPWLRTLGTGSIGAGVRIASVVPQAGRRVMSKLAQGSSGAAALFLAAGLALTVGGAGAATTGEQTLESPGSWITTNPLVYRASGPVITMRNGRVLSVGDVVARFRCSAPH
jgi:hypothetical protein